MPKPIVAVPIALALGFVIAFGLSYLLASNGIEPGHAPWTIGGGIAFMLSMAAFGMAGNRNVATASNEARAAALALTPKPGEAMLVIYREGVMGRAQGMNITLDGKAVTQLKGIRFTALSIAPGRHVLSANLAGPGQTDADGGEATFDLEPGAAIVFRATIKMKLVSGGVVFTRIDDLTAAKAKLAKLPMIAPD